MHPGIDAARRRLRALQKCFAALGVLVALIVSGGEGIRFLPFADPPDGATLTVNRPSLIGAAELGPASFDRRASSTKGASYRKTPPHEQLPAVASPRSLHLPARFILIADVRSKPPDEIARSYFFADRLSRGPPSA